MVLPFSALASYAAGREFDSRLRHDFFLGGGGRGRGKWQNITLSVLEIGVYGREVNGASFQFHHSISLEFAACHFEESVQLVVVWLQSSAQSIPFSTGLSTNQGITCFSYLDYVCVCVLSSEYLTHQPGRSRVGFVRKKENKNRQHYHFDISV